MRRKSFEDALCPVARSLDVIGDWWSLLIVRDALLGKRRFTDFQQNLGMAKNILSTRLQQLVQEGVLEVRPAPERPDRNEYFLTEKGRELKSVLVALGKWGQKNCSDGKPAPHPFLDPEDEAPQHAAS